MLGKSIAQYLAATLLAASTVARAQPSTPATDDAHSKLVTRLSFRDEFESFNKDTWSCEYDCPLIEGAKARFRLRSGVEPDNYGSWSKAKFKGQQFTSGRFTVSFSLTARPRKQPVWWGVALYGTTPDGEVNEVNFGYTTDQSFEDSQLWFETYRRGESDPVKVETNVNLYDEQYHTATLEYDENHAIFILDGEQLAEITNTSVIPTDPMSFLLGPRLVTGGDPLTEGFTQSIDWVEIEA